MSKIAMPSPNGTNRAGLYLPSRGPQAAYDAATGLRDDLRDETGKLDPEKINMLGGHMSPNTHPATRVVLQMLAAAEKAGLSGDALGTLQHIAQGWLSRPSGTAKDDANNYEWAANWAREKGMSEDDINEFVSGLQQHSDQPPAFAGRPTRGSTPLPLNAQDRKRMANDAARAAASSGRRAAFERRYPSTKHMQPSTNESVSALRGHLAKIGTV